MNFSLMLSPLLNTYLIVLSNVPGLILFIVLNSTGSDGSKNHIDDFRKLFAIVQRGVSLAGAENGISCYELVGLWLPDRRNDGSFDIGGQ
jgi:hypothetical protein